MSIATLTSASQQTWPIERPHEVAIIVDHSLEEAYLLATSRQAVRVWPEER